MSACDREASSTPSAAGTLDHEPRDEQSGAARVESRLHHRTSGQRYERAAAEREVERGEEDDERDPGERARREMGAMGGETEREQDRERRQQPEGVPVADRLGQLIAARGVVRPADVTGEEPGAERVERHEHGSRNDTAEEPSRGLAGRQEQ